MLTGRDATTPYSHLKWKSDGFSDFDLYSHTMSGDGSCLIHSICYALYVPYHRRFLDGRKTSRREIVRRYRDELADKLTAYNLNTGLTYYESIEDGKLVSRSKDVPEYSLESIQKLLRSDDSLDVTIISIIESVLGISIYILDSREKDLYMMTRLPPRQWSVVLQYTGNHFNTVSVLNPTTNTHTTSFKEDHAFIKFLRRRHMQKGGSA